MILNETFLLMARTLVCPSPLVCFGCQSLVRYRSTRARRLCLTFQFCFSGKWKGAAVHSRAERVQRRAAGGWPLDKPGRSLQLLNHRCFLPVIGNWLGESWFVCVSFPTHSASIFTTVPRWLKVRGRPEFAENCWEVVLLLEGSYAGRLK